MSLSVLLISSLLATPRLSLQAQGGTFESDNVLRATVLIHQVYFNTQGTMIIACEGSGTLVSADGLILTNAHNALPSGNCKSDRVVVSLTLRIGEAPVPTYYAEVVNVNRGWDLAVLNITNTLDNRPVDRTQLSLPFVEVAEAENIQLDDTIEVVGYSTPDTNATSNIASVIRGTISGFTAEARLGDRAWMKTRAAIPGTFSGGGAYNVTGQLIGVPTVEPTLAEGAAVNCRRVQDANADGRVDDSDTCIPVGGFINALRPVRLARSLVLAAKLYLTASIQNLAADSGTTNNVSTPTQRPAFKRLLFSSGVNAAGMPTTIVSGMPAGATTLYLFFDYENMQDGMIYEMRVTRDGVLDATFSLAPATWSGGQNGLWYIGSTAQTWPNGVYQFDLFIEGTRASESAKITIGGAARSDPVASDILFGVVNPEGQLVNSGSVLPAGSTITAEFIYNNMTPNVVWQQRWYYEDIRLPDVAATQWADPTNGKKQIRADSAPERPFQPGRYRLEIWIDNRLAATSDFIMIGGQVDLNIDIFSNLTFTDTLDTQNSARIIGTTFNNTIPSLYATFDWREIATGTPWTWRWTVDNNLLFEETVPWQGLSTGSGYWSNLRAVRGTLPDGTYRIDLLIGGVIRATASAKVGLGQLPVTTFGTAQGISLQGTITDAETGQGIPGVMLILLKPKVDVADFVWDMNQVYAISLTDAQGAYTFAKLLTRGTATTPEFYSILIIARGYLPLSADGIEAAINTSSPMVMRLQLNKD